MLGTKPQDADLYPAFERRGYVIRREWDPNDRSEQRVIFAPPLTSAGKDALEAQAEAFRYVLNELYRVGGWTVYADELAYLNNRMKLGYELDTLYEQGRSINLTMVAATQRPRNVPVNAFAMAEWFAFWRLSNSGDRRHAAGLIGSYQGLANEAMLRLPQYEVVVVNTATDEIVRSKVARR